MGYKSFGIAYKRSEVNTWLKFLREKDKSNITVNVINLLIIFFYVLVLHNCVIICSL